MRISDWSSDVCSSDLSSKAFTFAQASLGLGKESSAPPTLAKNRPSAHRRADIFLKECMTWRRTGRLIAGGAMKGCKCPFTGTRRSEEHTSELQSLMRISYAVFCLKKKKTHSNNTRESNT